MGGAKRLWERKVPDLGSAESISIAHQVAARTDTEVVQVDRWLPNEEQSLCRRCLASCDSLEMPH